MFRVVARVGYVVLGVLHIVIGVIAISFVTGGGGGEADQGGAMEQIADAPLGVLLLWLIVLGLLALAVWQVAEAFLERNPDHEEEVGVPGEVSRHRGRVPGDRVHRAGVRPGRQSDSSQSSQSFSAQLMSTPGGIVLLVLFGLLIAGIGVAFIIRGITPAFKKQLDLPPDPAGSGIVAFGVIGYVAKGIAIGVTGVLFVVAALTHDPETAGGLDAALRTLAGLPLGPVILWIVGLGLILYGLYCFARARYAKM